MTGPDDELDRLRKALKAEAPRPDAQAREQALRMAMESFDARQENREHVRLMKDGPEKAGFLSGVFAMFDRLTTRAGLLTTASVALTAAGLFIIAGPQMNGPRTPWQSAPSQPSPVQAPANEATEDPTAAAPAAISAPAALPAPAVLPAPVPASEPAPASVTATMSEAAMPEISEAEAALIDLPPQAAQPAPNANAPQMAEMASKMTADQAAPVAGRAALANRMAPQGGAVSSGAPAPAYAADAVMIQPKANDSFAPFQQSPLQITAQTPVSTFSVDVDTAAWSWLRGALRMGQLPDPASVRIEEMINYFPYDYAAPDGDQPFSTQISVFQTPWNTGTKLVRIGLQGQLPQTEARPPLNLVFLVDTSGSMEGPERLGLLRSAFGMLLDSLRPEDRVAIVAYAGSAGEVLAPTPASDRGAIMAALNSLSAGGSTAGGEGLALAYDLAAKMRATSQDDRSIQRIVLATDGDFNLGMSDPEELKAFVEKKRESGSYLSVLGFGRGNLDDALMQALAQNGNGQAAYIDSAEEARKVLVDQAAGALFPIAGDVKIQVEWNPAEVAEYRLIGYETRALAREDFNNDKVDAGDIGAGHQVTALYEITPTDSDARRTDPLRYGTPNDAPAAQQGEAAEAGWLRLRYKRPGETASQLIEAPIPATASAPDQDAEFAAAIAGFGQLLSGSKFLGDWDYAQAIALAQSGKGEDPFGYRAEAIGLMRTADALAEKSR